MGGGPKRLLGQTKQDYRVLAGREEQDRSLEFCHHLSNDVNRFGFENSEFVDDIGDGAHVTGYPFCSASMR